MGAVEKLTALLLLPGMLGKATKTSVGTTGIVPESPTELAKQANVPVDQNSLARMLASEGYGKKSSLRGRALAYIGMGQAILNVANARKTSVTSVLTASTKEAGKGHYGRQNSKLGGTRKAATTDDPTFAELVFARAILDGSYDGNELPNIAQGATMFVDPLVFKGGMQAGQKLRSFDDVMTDWHKQVAWIGPVEGISSSHLVFLRPESSATKRAASLRDIMSMYQRGPGRSLLAWYLLFGFGVAGLVYYLSEEERKGQLVLTS